MKQLFTVVLGLASMLPAVASAASFTVTPASGSYKVGDTITLNVGVNPTGGTVYTAMLDARFSPSVFKVVSFTLADALLPLKTQGYDALDNSGGVLTKTGGYTGGTSSTASFGTVVLKVVGSSTGTFTVANSTKLLDSANANQNSGSQTFSYTVNAPVSVPSVTKTATPKQVATTHTPTKKKSSTQKNTTATATEMENATSSQVAAVVSSGTTLTTLWLAVLFAGLVAFVLGYLLGRVRAA